MDTTWKLRVGTEDLELWKLAAARNGVSLSAWARAVLRATAEATVES